MLPVRPLTPMTSPAVKTRTIALDIDVSQLDTDGSEDLSISISGIPSGAVLKDADGNEITVTDGVADVSADQLSGLTVTPPLDSDEDFDLTVTTTTTEDSTGATTTNSSTFTVQCGCRS